VNSRPPPSGRILSMPPLDHFGGGAAGHCAFCRIIRGEEVASIIHEDINCLAFLDIHPLFPAHTLVVSRRHYPDVLEVPEDIALHCMALARRLAPALRRATGGAGVNLFCANGRAGGQDVPHFHIHVIPIPEGSRFPLQLPRSDAAEAARPDLDRMAERITEAVQELNAP
jgi:histidine triad (HIT) family protein